ncbi:MAG TPA: hypothetical protein VFH61_07715 [Thermoleophilia bacterium]|nr:hypothetical protein [Thermoleophilia bacterium]
MSRAAGSAVGAMQPPAATEVFARRRSREEDSERRGPMSAGTRLLKARTVRWIDVAVVAWIVVWIALGALIWHDILAQSRLSDNVIKMGLAMKDTGEALAVVGGLPLVGGGISDFAYRITATGAEVESSGRDSRDSITRVALVSGFGVAVLPAAMALFLYLPVRIGWRRDVAAIAAALARQGGDVGLERYLAQRAVDALPWDRLCTLSDDPWRAIAEGDYRALADAELARLGLVRPR